MSDNENDHTPTTEIPNRTPPPLARTVMNANGDRIPVMEPPFVECGQVARIGGVPVVCIRRAKHPVDLRYGHTNGYKEWCFDTEPHINAMEVDTK